jgi:tetratricopeptide (TPR) repeat protein
MTSPLETALKDYDTALRTVEAVESPSPKQILDVLIARDAVGVAFSQSSHQSAQLLLTLLQLDERLKGQTEKIVQSVDLANWRASFHPPAAAWWWFLTIPQPSNELQNWLTRYETAIKTLEQTTAESKTTDYQVLLQQVVDTVVARDGLQNQLDNAESDAESLVKISDLDSRLEQQYQALPKKLGREHLSPMVAKLDELREIRHPPAKAWWWFAKIPVHWWDRLDLAWDTLAIVWLAATFSLLTDISSRFLSGGVGTFGAFAIIGQSMLALAGGGALTKTGQTVVQGTLKRWRIPKQFWQEAKFGAASLLLLFFVGFRLSLPRIALIYNNMGYRDYQAGRLDSAESQFKRAIKLNPDYAEAHYHLGIIYEDLQDLKRARKEYGIAVQSGFPVANSNLARLHILSKNYPVAVNLLLNGIVVLETDYSSLEGKEFVQYSLYKNLGWARLKQRRYEEARDTLKQAIAIQPEQASAHCLLARVLEELDKDKQALEAWVNCDKYPGNPNTPEEDEWIHQAKQRLKAEELP